MALVRMIVSREVHPEGEPGYPVYVLLSGEVNIVTYANGKEHLIATMRKGKPMD